MGFHFGNQLKEFSAYKFNMMYKKKNQLCGLASDIKISTLVLDWRGVPSASLGNAHASPKLGSRFLYLKPDHIKDSYNLTTHVISWGIGLKQGIDFAF